MNVLRAHSISPEERPVLLTLAETAEQLRCSRSHLNRLMRGRYPTLPPFPRIVLGSRVVVRRDALNAWLLLLESQEREAAYRSGLSIRYIGEDFEFIAGA